jgi:hypothetical protein
MAEPISIPAEIVPNARDGVMYLFGLAADAIGNETDRAIPDLAGPLERFDALRALLEALPANGMHAADVDGAYRPLLLDALWEDAEVTMGLRDGNARDGARGTALRQAGEVEALTSFIVTLTTTGEEA